MIDPKIITFYRKILSKITTNENFQQLILGNMPAMTWVREGSNLKSENPHGVFKEEEPLYFIS
jgi:hypothetical protein